jgi:hypothetical protein
MHLLAFADEKLNAEIVLKLAYPRRNVGLHAIELSGSASNASLTRNRLENAQGRKIDGHSSSQIENIKITIIHFIRKSCRA